MYNFDETPINFGMKYHERAVTSSSKKRVTTQIPERRTNMSLCLTICADGTSLRSKLIWKGSKVPPEFSSLTSHKIDVLPNSSGYQTKLTFETMMDDLTDEMIARRTELKEEDKHILLILDSHVSRISSKFLQKCYDNRITVLTIIPHSSSRTQPLDLVPNAVLKRTLWSVYKSLINPYLKKDAAQAALLQLLREYLENYRKQHPFYGKTVLSDDNSSSDYSSSDDSSSDEEKEEKEEEEDEDEENSENDVEIPHLLHKKGIYTLKSPKRSPSSRPPQRAHSQTPIVYYGQSLPGMTHAALSRYMIAASLPFALADALKPQTCIEGFVRSNCISVQIPNPDQGHSHSDPAPTSSSSSSKQTFSIGGRVISTPEIIETIRKLEQKATRAPKTKALEKANPPQSPIDDDEDASLEIQEVEDKTMDQSLSD